MLRSDFSDLHGVNLTFLFFFKKEAIIFQKKLDLYAYDTKA